MKITDKTLNNGVFSWIIPNIKPGKYKIRIKTVDSKVFNDSQIFSITKATLYDPNAPRMDPNFNNVYHRENTAMLDPKYQIKPNILYLDKLPNLNKFGPKCPGNTGCSIKFVNNTQLTIVALNIKRLDTGKVENPIIAPNQAISPGGFLSISEFYDTNYVYQAFYGTWSAGQAKPTYSTTYKNGPVSAPFAGSSKVVYITDPNAKNNVNKQYQDAVNKLTSYKPYNDWQLQWASYSKCSGVCTDVLRIYRNGNFEYWELNSQGQLWKVSQGTYKIVGYSTTTKIISFVLYPGNNSASFSTAQYSYSNNGIMGKMSLCINVNTVNLGQRTACFGN